MSKYNNELKDHKLICGWCEQSVSLEDVKSSHKVSKRDRFTHSCEHCTRRSEIKVGVLGFYSLYSYNKHKYFVPKEV
jgi:uncharacterized CHY-type Zn-finger protein